jgi:hypothetical protein
VRRIQFVVAMAFSSFVGRKPFLLYDFSAHFVLRKSSIIFVCLTIILDVDFFGCLFGL